MYLKIIDNLLEIQYDKLSDLQSELTPNLLRIDTVGIVKTNYTGFNYKSKVLQKWGTQKMKKLLKKYKEISYVIGYLKGDIDTRNHEYSHYLFFNDPLYRYNAIKKYSDPSNKHILEYLRKIGYKETVLFDEAAAFFGL